MNFKRKLKKGAKQAGRAVKHSARTKYTEYKYKRAERKAFQRELEAEAKKERRKAYKKAYVKQARKRARSRAKQKAAGGGFLGGMKKGQKALQGMPMTQFGQDLVFGKKKKK